MFEGLHLQAEARRFCARVGHGLRFSATIFILAPDRKQKIRIPSMWPNMFWDLWTFWTQYDIIRRWQRRPLKEAIALRCSLKVQQSAGRIMRAIFEICLRRGRLTVKSLVRNDRGKGWEREGKGRTRERCEKSRNRIELAKSNEESKPGFQNENEWDGDSQGHDLRLGSTGIEGSQLVPRIWNAWDPCRQVSRKM